MAEDIINRVSNSKLKLVDLEDYYPDGKRLVLDIKNWLYEELVLREKEFRQFVNDHDWSQYKDAYVVINCSSDAIIPDWAYMLITTQLQPYAKFVASGDLQSLDSLLFTEIINNLDVSQYKDAPVIIKGCATKPVPVDALIQLTNKLKPIAKSIMFGEACSSVPLYKRK
ncbi:MAG: DUF2480 family protein [Winogradskyella sp.]|nr:DUF2480 family protein [Winogradskyella sp.]NNC46742.1 DUF2480 family protein [Winogradskyella sp.]NNK39161.1 DUF2480 family protein [Winogradskyella sp.]NNL82408.1 DUF2480 family protein [Winogradskyella sp.]